MNAIVRQLIRFALGSTEIGYRFYNRIDYKDRHLFCNFNKPISQGKAGNDLVAGLIGQNRPFMISRLGSLELSCLTFYLQNGSAKQNKYPRTLCNNLSNIAGVFPANDKLLNRFSELYLGCMKHTDIMGVWYNFWEDRLCNNYCPDANLVELSSLESFRFSSPWSARLRGKKVLVVHPFSESIVRQYTNNRHLLFADPSVLPDFELKTVKAVQSLAGESTPFVDWFEAYDHMCAEIAVVDFDIAIIGAGAYGLPLAAFVKGMGKQAIHLGGVTQILFGIKGRRWEEAYADSIGRLFNEHWIRPAENEVPSGYRIVEGGCYW
jgi:hypothetical protein